MKAAHRVCPVPGCGHRMYSSNQRGVCTRCWALGARPQDPSTWPPKETFHPDPNAPPKPSLVRVKAGVLPLVPNAVDARAAFKKQAQDERNVAEDYPYFEAPPVPLGDSPQACLKRVQGSVLGLITVIKDPRVRRHLLKAQLQLGLADVALEANGSGEWPA